MELIRSDPEYVTQALRKRGEDAPISQLLELDVQRRQLIQHGDELRAQRNEASRRISQMAERPPELIEEMRKVGGGHPPLRAGGGRA